MLKTIVRRVTALLAAGGMLLSSSVALAAPPESPVLFVTPGWPSPAEEELPPDAPTTPEPSPELLSEPIEASPVLFLLRLPPENEMATLAGPAGTQQLLSSGDGSVVAAAPPGDYTITFGDRTADIALDEQGDVTVLSGAAAWDGEQLTLGSEGTLELHCLVAPGAVRMMTIEAVDGRHMRSAGYDPLMDGADGCDIVHQLTLPAGQVTVTCGGVLRQVELLPGETVRLDF